MALLSPGVEVVEKDMSLTVSTAGSSFGAYVGAFKKGEANKVKLITNETQLKNIFGAPDNSTYKDFFTCAHFLKYTDSLWVVRAVDDTFNVKTEVEATTANNLDNQDNKVTFNDISKLKVGAKYSFKEDGENIYTIKSIDTPSNSAIFVEEITDTIRLGTKIYRRECTTNAFCEIQKDGEQAITTDEVTAELIANEEDFSFVLPSISFTADESKLKFIAKDAGMVGNSLSVAIATPTDFENNEEFKKGITVNSLFQYAPVDKQFAVIVLENDKIVETFIVSIDPSEVNEYNKSVFCETVINKKSSYIYVKCNTTSDDMPNSALDSKIVKLKFGKDGAPSKANLASALEYLADPETIDVDIVLANEQIKTQCIEFAEKRADCICYLGMDEDQVVGLKADKVIENVVKARQALSNTKFATLIDNYIQVYDKYNDKDRWLAPVGYAAGLRAFINNKDGHWFASAGLDNGQLTGVTKIAYSPNNAQRDQLYKNDINPVVNFPGQGIVLWGQKTLYGKPSVFDRVNVRMLFNYLERTIAKSAKYVIFTQNDEIQRNLFISLIDPVLAQVKTRRGIDDYKIVCDSTNNTPLVVSNNQFVADILIKPTYVTEFITLNFVAVGATLSFDEVIGAV